MLSVFGVISLGLGLAVAQPPAICYRAQMPNEADPYSFYKCDASGQAHLWRCAAGTIYDRELEICNWEDSVRGRNDGGALNGTVNDNSTRRGGANNGGWAENDGYGYGNVNRFANEYPLEGPGALGEDRPDWEGGEPWEVPRQRQRELQEQMRRQQMILLELRRQFEETQSRLQEQAPVTPTETPSWRNTAVLRQMICLASDAQPRMYMNPDDCSTYYTCNMGRPVLTYCLRGHYFNPERRTCDDQVHAGCTVVNARVEVLGVTEVEGSPPTATDATRRSSRRRNRLRIEKIVDPRPVQDNGKLSSDPLPSDDFLSSKENVIPSSE